MNGALSTLASLHNALPADEQVLLALVNYSMEADQQDIAARYVTKLLTLAPQNPNYRRLAANIQQSL
jgi:hypothetical protein